MWACTSHGETVGEGFACFRPAGTVGGMMDLCLIISLNYHKDNTTQHIPNCFGSAFTGRVPAARRSLSFKPVYPHLPSPTAPLPMLCLPLLSGEPRFKHGSVTSGRRHERQSCIISPCKVLELCHRWPGAKTIWTSTRLWPSCLWLRESKRGLLWVKFSAGPQSAREARADGWLLTGKAVGRRRRSAALRPPGEESWWSLKWISFMFHYRLLQPCESTLWVLSCKWGTGRGRLFYNFCD